MFDEGQKSKWSHETQKITEIAKSHGIMFFNRTARAKGLLKNELLKLPGFKKDQD